MNSRELLAPLMQCQLPRAEGNRGIVVLMPQLRVDKAGDFRRTARDVSEAVPSQE